MAICTIFKLPGVRHRGFLHLHNFNGDHRSVCITATIFVQLVKTLLRHVNFSTFPEWQQCTMLDLYCTCSEHWLRAWGHHYHRAQFHLSQCTTLN